LAGDGANGQAARGAYPPPGFLGTPVRRRYNPQPVEDTDLGAGMERTLIIFKPDAVQRQLVGRILARFEDKGLRIAAMKLQQSPRAQVERHYAVHRASSFYPSLVEFMTCGPVILTVLEGPSAIAVVRNLLGATDGRKADPGTIRGDFGLDQQHNLVHASDGPDTAKTEIELFFRPDEIVGYERATEPWISREYKA
jgi:nucleoside-diphosphate kinase